MGDTLIGNTETENSLAWQMPNCREFPFHFSAEEQTEFLEGRSSLVAETKNSFLTLPIERDGIE